MRHLLVALTIAVAALAGCGGSGPKTTAATTTAPTSTPVASSATEDTTKWVSPCETPGACKEPTTTEIVPTVTPARRALVAWCDRVRATYIADAPTAAPSTVDNTLAVLDAWPNTELQGGTELARLGADIIRAAPSVERSLIAGMVLKDMVAFSSPYTS